MVALNSKIAQITDRIRNRSARTRNLYLTGVERALEQSCRTSTQRSELSCTNLAHAIAASSEDDKTSLREQHTANLGIITSYNDMLSAHQPYETYPALIRQAAREVGATAQVAGATPAMCDGVTQGQPGMELSLFSRDTIALSTAIALSHNMFDTAVYLGICDKIVPGLLIGALAYGHLPAVFVPAGPMTTGISNSEKAMVRQRFASGQVGRSQLLESECRSYHGPGTCTFYGTANSNQMLMEIMGLHLPGAAFVNPGDPLREALTKAAAQRALELSVSGESPTALGQMIDERTICNSIVGLMATGGSTNHTIHLVAIARAAGILIDWDDFGELSDVVPLLARVYPNGSADVNQFHSAGGMARVIGELLSGGYLHADVNTITGKGLEAYTTEPVLETCDNKRILGWRECPSDFSDQGIIRSVTQPWSPDGGLKVLRGNLGRAVIKTSALEDEQLKIEAEALVFDSQESVLSAFEAGELDRDFVAIVRFQGPRANGMPELHKLTPVLGVLQDRGYRVALVTDGRMSGASGKVPAAIHVSPECRAGGPLSKVRSGDQIRLDAVRGELLALIDDSIWSSRTSDSGTETSVPAITGSDVFGQMRGVVSDAESGASFVSWC